MLDGPLPARQASVGPPERRPDSATAVRPALGAVSIAPVDTPIGSSGFRRSLVVALLIHVLGIAVLGLYRPPGDGGGGVSRDVVSVDVVLVAPATPAVTSGPQALSGTAGDGAATGATMADAPAGAAPAPVKDASDAPRARERDRNTSPTPAPVVAALSDDEPVAAPKETAPERKVESFAAHAPSPPMAVAGNGSGVPLTTGSLPNVAKRVAAPAASAGEVRRFTRDVARLLSRRRPQLGGRKLRGTVRVAFGIGDGGDLTFVRVAESSGNGVLDDLALAAVRSTRFPPPPAGMTERQLTYEIPYHFR